MPHVHFTFPDPLKKELEKSIPLRERSQFVSQATQQALQMKRLKEMLLSKKYVGTYREGNPEALARKFRARSRRIKKLA